MREDQYLEFAEKMRQSESSGDYSVVNSYGFMGAYQFGKPRLWDLGISIDGYIPKNRVMKIPITKDYFRSDSNLQDWMFKKHVQDCILRVGKYNNLEIMGNRYTTSAFVGVMHLLGYGGVKNLIKGDVGADANGTTALDYANKFNDIF